MIELVRFTGATKCNCLILNLLRDRVERAYGEGDKE